MSGTKAHMDITEQQKFRNDITYDMFVESAERNYIIARWCFQNGLASDFLWNAAHCLEKLMKGVLLLNGRSAKEYRHALLPLYKEIKDIAKDLLLDQLIKPTNSNMLWHDEKTKAFIKRISEGGDSNNRYQVHGYAMLGEELCKLDQVVFAILRLCCPLDSYIPGGRRKQSKITYRCWLKQHPRHVPFSARSQLKKAINCKGPEELCHAALNQNHSFAPDYDHKRLRYGSSSSNSVLYRRILYAEEQSVTSTQSAAIVDLINWTLDSIFLPSSIKSRLKSLRDQLKDVHGH